MEGTFEMPGDGFVDIGLVAALHQHPIGEAFMQLGARLLRETSIRCLADERMRESPLPAGLVIRMHQAAAVQGRQGLLDRSQRDIRHEDSERRRPEPSTLDRGPLDDHAGVGI
jgi:hypothetical protein